MGLGRAGRRAFVVVGCVLAGARLGAGTQYVPEPQLDACGRWDDVVRRLVNGQLDGRAAREAFRALWPAVTAGDGAKAAGPRWQWMFPLPGYDASCFGESYDPDGYRFLDGPKAQGFPGLRLYIRDAQRRGLEDRTGKPQPVVSATDGVVLAAERFWKPGDPNPWGDYAWILEPGSRQLFLYADLGRLRVGPGQRVLRGEVVGWLGRTGAEVADERLGTQLRFEVHTFDDGLFYPVFPGRALRVAGHTEWPIPERIVRPRYRPPHDVPLTETGSAF